MDHTETATLAGGCFWGMQDLIRRLPGVLDTRVGYTGGHTEHATYDHVKTGATGHAEAIRITFDPDTLSYRQLLEFFFQIHDPSTADRQGNDHGTQYRSAIFTHSGAQDKTARALITEIEQSGHWPGKVVTEISPARAFWDAEDVHQDYLVHYPNGYTCHFVRPKWALN